MRRSTSIIAMLALASITYASQAPTTLRVDVRLVNVVTTVTDGSGKFVPNLKPEDFTVLEDGVPQKISIFTQDRDVPVSVGILLDTSGSMIDKMRSATDAVDRFVAGIHADDDIFLMTFSGRIALEQDFTSDRKKLSRAMNSLKVGGNTLLYDGLKRALDKVHSGRHEKRAILVVTDGVDAGSKSSTLNSLLDDIKSAEVLVYGLGVSQAVYADPVEHVPFTLPTPSSAARRVPPAANTARRGNTPVLNMNVLTQFAENSGGQAFLLSSTFVNRDSSDIERVLATIAEELRGQYTLGYYPSKPDDGRFHTIKVTASGANNIRTRTGYQGRR
jgi:Ca-activated chloride channel family protein